MTKSAFAFDIVIPLGPNDKNVVENTLYYAAKNIIGFRHIFVISYYPNIIFKTPYTTVIDENIFPFQKSELLPLLGDRTGWYLQQLIKLYAVFVVPNILPNILVLDSDTIFLKPTEFFQNGLPLYNVGSEYHSPYFAHMNRLHPSLTRQCQQSGICHHMIFQKHILEKIIDLVETFHNEPFYKTFIQCIASNEIPFSGASEYEIYFHYLHHFHKNQFQIRLLKWTNLPRNNGKNTDDYDYISFHWYLT